MNVSSRNTMVKITIFGLAGTGTTTVGKLLATTLGYEFLSSGQLFRQQAESLGLSLYDFEVKCNADPSIDRALDAKIAEYGRCHDNFVLESRLAWHFIPDSFKVKITCDFETRVARVARRDQMDIAEKREKTLFRERSGEMRYKMQYGIDPFAPDSAFDLVLDSTTSSPDSLALAIMEGIGHRPN
jgi:cytidylate kinase